MINWLREGRLSRIGTVIVDEAHERSTNIDFIMGYLKQELATYPHLRVIITSATFNTDFYQEYFGGPDVASVMEVPAEKTFGYGMPLFPALDTAEDGEEDIYDRWTDTSLPLVPPAAAGRDAFIRQHWPDRYAPPLGPMTSRTTRTPGWVEDVWDTTAKLPGLRYDGHVPAEQWRERMPGEMAKFVIQLAKGLDEQGIFGDILGFLPTKRTIEPACQEIERALGQAYRDNVFPLISTLPPDRQRRALAKRRKGDARKIVISTNLAETSLTVEGVRFVVDSGVIAQSEWDPGARPGRHPHQAAQPGRHQAALGTRGPKGARMGFPALLQGPVPGAGAGHAARIGPGEPGSAGHDGQDGRHRRRGRLPLAGRLPADDHRTRRVRPRRARGVPARSCAARIVALRAGGAVDGDGHPTSFGKELIRFQGLGSTASALAVLYADRLACVPEVVTILALLEDTRLVGQRGLLLDDYEWPDEWRLEAADRHRGLATLCADDAELALLVAAAWERADPGAAPWEPSARRAAWARQWWVSHEVLLAAAAKRHEVLSALSPAMKEDVKRFLEPALIARARGVLDPDVRRPPVHARRRGDLPRRAQPGDRLHRRGRHGHRPARARASSRCGAARAGTRTGFPAWLSAEPWAVRKRGTRPRTGLPARRRGRHAADRGRGEDSPGATGTDAGAALPGQLAGRPAHAARAHRRRPDRRRGVTEFIRSPSRVRSPTRNAAAPASGAASAPGARARRGVDELTCRRHPGRQRRRTAPAPGAGWLRRRGHAARTGIPRRRRRRRRPGRLRRMLPLPRRAAGRLRDTPKPGATVGQAGRPAARLAGHGPRGRRHIRPGGRHRARAGAHRRSGTRWRVMPPRPTAASRSGCARTGVPAAAATRRSMST